MLNKEYKITDGNFNPRQEISENDKNIIKKEYKNLTYYTKDFCDTFENKDSAIIFSDIAKQQDHIIKEITLYEKYDFFTKAIVKKIKEQYKIFYLFEGLYYNIGELKERLTRKDNKENTFIKIEKTPKCNLTPEKKPTLTISRSAIRKITGYSPWVIPKWDKTGKAVYLEWQDTLLQDKQSIILVDGSRQEGKSLTIAEKAVELSFLPNQDSLVGAFIKKTTDIIRNYILNFIKNFPEGVFEHFKSEGYILNTKSGTKIYFRTLGDGAENVRGLTLYNIIVDESQLIPTYVFEEVLEPTLATTDGNMILIGTPGRSTKGYYYDLIMEAKKGIEAQGIKIAVRSKTNEDISYYQIDYTQNPLISPKKRKRIVENLHKASVQREWCCNWNSGEDKLLNPEVISKYPILCDDGYFIITFDPARKGTDRSAYCVLYIYGGFIYVILSGFVPQKRKLKWSDQIKFYATGLIKQFSEYKNVYYGVDLRGIGEGFREAWNNYFKGTLSLIEITYTTGRTKTIKGLNWIVSKTILISNTIDYDEERFIKILGAGNKDLLEELNFLYEDTDSYNNMSMKSTFKDDISNTLLTGVFICHTRGYLKREVLGVKEDNNQFSEWGKDFAPKTRKNKKKLNSVW